MESRSPVPEDRARGINRLIELGVLADAPDFYDYLVKRQYAIDWNAGAPKSQQVQAIERASNLSLPSPNVFLYHDDSEYDQGITHAQFETNLYLQSCSGGRDVVDAHNVSSQTETPSNPFNLTHCPQSNIKVATNLLLASYGGYFGKKGDKYIPPLEVAILHAYAYEFENFDEARILKNECPFIINYNEVGTKPLSVSIEGGRFIPTQVLTEDRTNVQELYFRENDYKEFIKNNLLKQMRAIVHAHQQSGLTEKDIQMNLTLPGMGFFANLGARWSIKSDLAPVAALAYKEALEAFTAEQQNRIPKITHIRLTYDARTPEEGSAIDAAFADVAKGAKIGDITVTKTADFVEQSLDSEYYQVVCVNGDPRANPGNEQGCASQEPGIYLNIVNGRAILSVIVNPFNTLTHSFDHHEILTLINQFLDDSMRVGGKEKDNDTKEKDSDTKEKDKDTDDDDNTLQLWLEEEQRQHNDRLNKTFEKVAIRGQYQKALSVRKTLGEIIHNRLGLVGLAKDLRIEIDTNNIKIVCANEDDLRVIQRVSEKIIGIPVAVQENSAVYNISKATALISYFTNLYQHEEGFKNEISEQDIVERLLLIALEEHIATLPLVDIAPDAPKHGLVGYSDDEKKPYFNNEGILIYSPKSYKAVVLDLDKLNQSPLIEVLKQMQKEKIRLYKEAEQMKVFYKMLLSEVRNRIYYTEWKWKDFLGMEHKVCLNNGDAARKLPAAVRKQWDAIQFYVSLLSTPNNNPDPSIVFKTIKTQAKNALAQPNTDRLPETTQYYKLYNLSDMEILMKLTEENLNNKVSLKK